MWRWSRSFPRGLSRSPILEEIVVERVQPRTVEQNVDVYMPRVAEEIVEVVQIILHERAWERKVEQIVDVSMPENEEQLVEKEFLRRSCRMSAWSASLSTSMSKSLMSLPCLCLRTGPEMIKNLVAEQSSRQLDAVRFWMEVNTRAQRAENKIVQAWRQVKKKDERKIGAPSLRT